MNVAVNTKITKSAAVICCMDYVYGLWCGMKSKLKALTSRPKPSSGDALGVQLIIRISRFTTKTVCINVSFITFTIQ